MGRHKGWPPLLAVVSALLSLSAAKDTVAPGDLLRDGDFLVSANGRFSLGFFTSGGSNFRYLGIWFSTLPVRTVVWVANRDRPLVDSTGAVLSIFGDGRLVLSDHKGTVYWSTGPTTALINPVATLLNNSNFVVTSSGTGAFIPAWQSFDYPADTLMPGAKIGWDLRSGRDRKLTSWRSADDPAPGEYSVGIDTPGDPQVYLVGKTVPIWRSGPWIGQQFSGVPVTASNLWWRFNLLRSADGVWFWYDVLDSSLLSRSVVQPTGEVDYMLWNENTQAWIRYWFAPRDRCDTMNTCGTFGVCDVTSESQICSCVRGFVPLSPGNWELRDWSDGCMRRAPVDCRNGTDGFVRLSGVKLPGTSAALVDHSMGLEQCRAACLRNCSCSAYAIAEATGAGGVRGCVLWGGNLTDLKSNADGGPDLFVRVAAADLVQQTSGWKSSQWVAVMSTVGAVLCTLVVGFLCWFLRRSRRRKTTKTRVLGKSRQVVAGSGNKTRKKTSHAYESGTGEGVVDLPVIDFSRIAAATGGFSDENKLGEGGFGPVYVGRMEDGQEVAVKRMARNSTQGVEEFKNEVVLIAKLQHRNLVRLLGCCIQWEERMLVYEYMPNGSLDTFLFGTHERMQPQRGLPVERATGLARVKVTQNTAADVDVDLVRGEYNYNDGCEPYMDRTKGSLLDWNTRYRIIKGIARGLLYLHHDSRLRIIHRDLKASNVLLDMEMNPKISDFGMARMFSGHQTEANTKRVVGTYGYMSPEYIMRGLFSAKSDVFSFGVVVLETVSGRRNRAIYLSDPNLNLLGYAWSLWKTGNWIEMVDSSMADGFPAAEVLKCIKVGLLCVQERPEDRPTMASVVEMWGGSMESLPQPKQPAFMATRGPFEVWSLSKGKLCSVNEVTVTDACDGR